MSKLPLEFINKIDILENLISNSIFFKKLALTGFEL